MLFATLCYYQGDLPVLSRLTNFAYLLLYVTIDTSEQGELESEPESKLENGKLESGTCSR